MSFKERCYDYVEDRKSENDDGTWRVCDPITRKPEDRVFATEKEIDDYLWPIAIENV